MKWFSKGFQSFLNLCQAETRRLILVMVLMFGVILVFQYVELPYGNVLSSLFSAGKVPVPGNSRSEIVGDKSLPSDSSYNATYSGQKVPNNTRTSSFLLDRNENLKVYFGLEEDLENVDNLIVEKEAKPPEHSFIGFSTPVIPPIDSFGSLSSAPAIPLIDSSPHTDEIITPEENERPEGEQSQENAEQKVISSTMPVVMEKNKQPQIQKLEVYTLSDMNKFLWESHVSNNSVIPRWSSPVDYELQSVKLQIENAPILKNYPDLYVPLYHNVSLFKRSYELMEKTLKVYIYREGESPILHTPVLGGIYASEGWLMKLLETNKKFVTKNPRKAHLFYLPFSSLMLKETLYVPNSHSRKNIVQYLKNYLDMIAAKYSYWNRTEGAGHFLVACHDWATSETKQYMSKCIRALCNADVKEGFVFGKDVSLPETYIRLPKNPLRDIGGKPPSKRSVLAFFAGSMHGYIRPILLQHWENKDPDMKIFGELPKSKGNTNYVNYMKSSKYCICAKGYEVNSPRVVEAIFYECVPVIISDNFVPPFFEVLNWESFAVFVKEKDIPNLKRILLSIPEKRFRQMQLRAKKVQQHFLWHPRPVKYDIFHMILHSVWFNRLYQIKPR